MPNVSCKVCNKEFYIKPCHHSKGWGKYCSKKCQNAGQRLGKLFPCRVCSKEVWRTPKEIRHSKSKNFFCSKSCQTIWRNQEYIEKKHRRWINGINAYRNIMKRSKVPQVCNHCGITDKRLLIVHHLDRNRTNNQISNLIWLCRNCHYLIHDGKTV
jgi:hypothetical protein